MHTDTVILKDAKQIERQDKKESFGFFAVYFVALGLGFAVYKYSPILTNSSLVRWFITIFVFCVVFAIGHVFISETESPHRKLEKDNIDDIVQKSLAEFNRMGAQVIQEICTEYHDRLCIAQNQGKVILYFYDIDQYQVKIMDFGFDDIEQIKIEYKPEEIDITSDDLNKYAKAGSMIGGLGGGIVGDFLDSTHTLGGKSVDFHLSFLFHLKEGKVVNFTSVNQTLYLQPQADDEQFDQFKRDVNKEFNKFEQHISVARKAFGDKLALS